MSCRNGLVKNKVTNMKHNNRSFRVWLLGTFFFSAVFCGSGFGQSYVPVVDVIETEVETLYTQRHWRGVLRPLRTISVPAPVEGRVDALLVTEGQTVEAGTPLLRVVSPELEARKTVLQERKETLAGDLARWERLAEANAAGPGEVEMARLRLLEAQETLAAVEALLASAHLLSPVAGRVVHLRVTENTLVARHEILLTVEEAESMGVRLRVPAVEARYFQDREKLALKGQGVAERTISRIVVAEDLATDGLLQVEILVATTGQDGPSEVLLVYAAPREAIVVPWTSVARDDDTHWVAVVTGYPPVIQRRSVVIGAGRAAGVEVQEGLEEGELVLRFEPRAHPEEREVRIPGRD